jgi:hypothetical protein
VPFARGAGPEVAPLRRALVATEMSSRTLTSHTASAPPRGSGFHLGTLIVAAISAVIAATVVSRIWQPGTVMATAMTPVLVTLVKEALERPARRVSSIAGRSTAVPVAPPEPDPRPEPIGSPPAVVVSHDEGLTPMRVYRPERRVRRRWKLALATGLLAFLIAVAAMTVPELVAGRSVVSAKHDTTIFGGQRHTSATTTKPEKKTTTEEQTVSTEKTPTDQTETQPQTTTTAPAQPTEPAPQTQTQTAPQTQTQPAPQTQTQPAPQTQTQPPPTTP